MREIMPSIHMCKECYSVLKAELGTGILNGVPIVGTIWKCPKCGYYRFEGHGKEVVNKK